MSAAFELREFSKHVGRMVSGRDGEGLSRELRMLDGIVLESAKLDSGQRGKPVELVESVFAVDCGEKFGPIASRLVCGRAAYSAGRLDAAYGFAVAAYNSLLGACRDEGGWATPLLRVMTLETRIVAERADDSKHEKLRDVETTLKKCFALCWTCRSGKKAASLYVVGQLMKIYFRLNLLKLAQPIIRSLGENLDYSQFPKGDVVTYRFFVGRLRIFEDQFVAAEDHLAYAFSRCHKDATMQKKSILKFLLAVRLRRGVVPRQRLLEKYDTLHLLPIVRAVQLGDLNGFNEHLSKSLRTGTFLLLQKCKLLVHRNLAKKVYLIQNKQSQLKLYLFKTAFFVDDDDRIECILANLIYKNLIKGYISHQKQTLVLSKKDPFPKMSS